jgi:hypothetical protein
MKMPRRLRRGIFLARRNTFIFYRFIRAAKPRGILSTANKRFLLVDFIFMPWFSGRFFIFGECDIIPKSSNIKAQMSNKT